jgi:hypothetical protein
MSGPDVDSVPTSEYDPSDTLTPAPPEGYANPTTLRYPLSILLGIVLVVTPIATLLFGRVLWFAQGPAALGAVFEFRETATSVGVTVRSSVVAVAFVGATVVVTILHELLHGLVYEMRGYRVSYGVAPQLGAFYAAAFHQFQRRDDNIVVGIAPLLVIDLLLVPILFVPNPALAFAAFVGLVFNTAGAAGDLYLVARLLRMPPNALLYDSDARHSYVYYPTDRRP